MCLQRSLVINQGDKCDINVSFIGDALIQESILLLMAPAEMWFSLCLIIHVPFFFFGLVQLQHSAVFL